jgi:PAS domain S-box-containing protein
MAKLSGYTLDEARGQDWFETFLPVEDRAKTRRSFCEMLDVDGRRVHASIDPVVTKQGELRTIHWSATVLEAAGGEVTGVLFVGIDITEQRAAEDEARSAEELTRAIVETCADGIITIDCRGNIHSFNRGAETMFGYMASEVVGQNVGLLIPQAHRERHDQDLSNYLRAKKAKVIGLGRELEGRRKDGTVFPIHLSLTELHLGENRGFCGFIRDRTEQKKAEQQMRQAQKMEAIGTLASGVAHDFNNLLMGVGGCASVALDCVDAGSAARMYLTEIKKAAESGAQITKQLLSFSRQGELEPAVFELNSAISRQDFMLRRLLGEDVALEVRLNAADSRIHTDVGQIDQVLMNLVVNARDAMPRGGRLTVETMQTDIATGDESQAADSLDVPAGSYVVLTVADDGCGMSDEIRDRVFDPFFTTKEAGKGTGLGLATVYGIVKQSRGHIRVHSKPGCGTRFEIFLPLAEGEPISRERHRLLPTAAAPGHGTILLCEDDRMVRMATRFYLQRAGYRVLEAENGAEAIECCARFSEPLDVFLTDIMLPGDSGDRVAAKVKRLKPDVKVLYMSAHSPMWLKEEGRIEHAVESLQKPFDEQQLLSRIRKLLGEEIADAEQPDVAPAQIPRRASLGTVVVAEDDDLIRDSLGNTLTQMGYEVLAASDGIEAVRRASDHDGPIAALVVDAVLPKQMGVAVARDIKAVHPGICVIYTSGYPRQVAMQEDLVGADCLFVQKPVAAEALHEMIQRARGANGRIESPPTRGRVLVVEDSAAARMALSEYLKNEGWDVCSAESGSGAMELIHEQSHPFDALLVDYSLPDIKGDELAGQIRTAMPKIAVVYMSGYPELELTPPGPNLDKPLDLQQLAATLGHLVGSARKNIQ